MEHLIGKKVKIIDKTHPYYEHEGIVLNTKKFPTIEETALVIDRNNGHSCCVFDINDVEEVK